MIFSHKENRTHDIGTNHLADRSGMAYYMYYMLYTTFLYVLYVTYSYL